MSWSRGPPDLGPFISWEPSTLPIVNVPKRFPRISESSRLIKWFQKYGGSIDTSAVDFIDIPGQGRGAVALKDIPEGHTLFTIPRSLVLSTRTSDLPSRFGEKQWKEYELDQGWAGLILCMMWEMNRRNSESRWRMYLDALPTKFDTPMFWDEADLEELEGTSLLEKIGKADAQKEYFEKVVPAMESRTDLFPVYDYYSFNLYHLMGSRILSRSFTLGEPEDDDGMKVAEKDASADSAMDVDDNPSVSGHTQTSRSRIEDDDHEMDDDDDDDTSEIAMVPMADMLNARSGCDNAKLFHEPNVLKMITTKPIKAKQQIFNTYGDLPNSELLRRYGYVDLVPLQEGLGEGNPADTAEIRADLVVDVVSGIKQTEDERYKDRIDWYLDEGGDDIFILDLDMELPGVFISLIRLLMIPSDEWTKTRDKGKMPKAKLDDVVLGVAQGVLENRLAMYPTNMTEDENLLNDSKQLLINKRHAIIVRLGEKRILNGTLKKMQEKRNNGSHESRKAKRRASPPESGQDGNEIPMQKKPRPW